MPRNENESLQMNEIEDLDVFGDGVVTTPPGLGVPGTAAPEDTMDGQMAGIDEFLGDSDEFAPEIGGEPGEPGDGEKPLYGSPEEALRLLGERLGYDADTLDALEAAGILKETIVQAAAGSGAAQASRGGEEEKAEEKPQPIQITEHVNLDTLGVLPDDPDYDQPMKQQIEALGESARFALFESARLKREIDEMRSSIEFERQDMMLAGMEGLEGFVGKGEYADLDPSSKQAQNRIAIINDAYDIAVAAAKQGKAVSRQQALRQAVARRTNPRSAAVPQTIARATNRRLVPGTPGAKVSDNRTPKQRSIEHITRILRNAGQG